jgi:hypothetical protein
VTGAACVLRDAEGPGAGRSVGWVSTQRRRTAALPGAEWARAWALAVEITWSAPVVIAYRTGRMLTGGWPPSARDRREYARMWQEKVDAFGRAYLAAITTPPQETARVLAAAAGPVHRRVVANRRRLARL